MAFRRSLRVLGLNPFVHYVQVAAATASLVSTSLTPDAMKNMKVKDGRKQMKELLRGMSHSTVFSSWIR